MSTAGSVLITAVGLTSSLGTAASQSCAAARAGITRLSGLEGFSVLDESTGELVAIAGHVAAGGIVAGFRGAGRIVELARLALEDLLAGVNLAPPFKAPLVISVGGAYYTKRLLLRDLAPAAEGLPHTPEAIADAEVAAFKSKVESSLLARLGERLGPAFDPVHSRVFFGEQASGGESLKYATDLLSKGTVPAVVVGGVDTLVDEGAVRRLLDLKLLKQPTLDAGFFPGEAAAFALLETPGRGAAPQRGPKAVLRSVAFKQGAPDRFAENLPVGAEIAEVLSLAANGAAGAKAGLLINSLNGDRWASWDWGHAVPRLEPAVAALPQWQPAESFGEIGAATMATMICMAVAGYERGYLRAEHVLLCGIGYDGGRAAAMLGSAG